MNERIFNRCIIFFGSRKAAYNILRFIYKLLPLVMFIAYPSLLIYAFFAMRESLFKLIIVPLSVFVFVSLLRIIINEERPYERYGKPSVFHKETKGKSFPSRHTASAFIIAMAFLYVSIPLGVVMLAIALAIELSRIFAGVHYVHDVVGGSAISILAGVIFIFLI